MGLESHVYVGEIEDDPSGSQEFDVHSWLIGSLVLLFIVVSTFLGGYGISLLIGALIH